MDTQTAPFARGQTYYNGSTIDSNNLGGVDLEGRICTFKDRNTISGIGGQTLRSGTDTVCMCVRNVGAAALKPKFSTTFASGYHRRRVDGYSTADYANIAGIVDDLLPAAGVPVNDLFWIVIGGPCLWKSPMAGAQFPLLVAQNDELFALTAITSGATTAGRFQKWNGTFTATQTTDGTAGLIALRAFARAMSAQTTSQTNSDLLVDVIRRY